MMCADSATTPLPTLLQSWLNGDVQPFGSTELVDNILQVGGQIHWLVACYVHLLVDREGRILLQIVWEAVCGQPLSTSASPA
jgi:hypothetical protein